MALWRFIGRLEITIQLGKKMQRVHFRVFQQNRPQPVRGHHCAPQLFAPHRLRLISQSSIRQGLAPSRLHHAVHPARRSRFSARSALDERKNKTTGLRTSLTHSDDRSHQLQHAIIMPESAGGCVLWTWKQPRRELLRRTTVSRRRRAMQLGTVQESVTSGRFRCFLCCHYGRLQS